ncbi:ENTH domain-containing protein [Phthorimaea operculella]|nr:ENTH domain-containing protein [Phthorimaea operculella]
MDRFISMWKVRELADKVTNVVMNYTEIEGKVREATSDEAWGPTGAQMQELALATFTYEHFPEVMSMLWRRMLHDNRSHWRRTYKELALATFTYEHFPEVMSMLWRRMLHDNRSHWRRTYKCLLLLSYLVRNGSERVVTSAREHIYDLRSLENYTYVDDLGKDQGINVRHKVRELIDFIQDDEKLREERKKAKKNKDKYIGMSSEASVMGMGSMRSGGNSGGWGEYSDRSSNWDEPKERRDRDDEDDYGGRDSDDDDYSHKTVQAERPRPNKENVYRDSETIADSPPRRSDSRPPADNKTLNISLKSPAKQKPSTPSKKIDLGAAATFAKAAASTSPPPPANTQTNNKSQELLDDLFKTCPAPSSLPSLSGSLVAEDDFDPRADDPKPAERKDSAEFGDFSNAFGAPPAAANDGFADFSSAFSGGNTNQSAVTSTAPPSASNLDLLSDLSPPPLLPAFNNINLNPANNMSNSLTGMSSSLTGMSNMDALTSQMSATTLQPSMQPIQPVDRQYAYRKGKSTTTAAHQVTDSILTSIDDRYKTAGIFCDLTKAFDVIQSDLLLDKLHRYGINDNTYTLLQSFLSGRKQLVEVTTNGRKYRSVAGDVTIGIPQGSSLGNTLFLAFINDLSHFITEGLVVLFADDTTVILCARTYEELNTKITCTYNKLQEWFSSNGLILNASKSNLILFSAKSIEKPLSINSPVPICLSCKFLGFTLDPNLNWKIIHVQTLCDRLTGAAYALRKLRPVVSSSVLKQTYFAHFQSLMSYGILLWGTSVDSERVFVLQKRAIRIMADIEKTKTNITQEKLLRAIRNCQETFLAMEAVKSENDVRNIKICLENIQKYLPGPITVQKLTSTDEKILDTEVTDTLSRLLGLIVRMLLPHWPVLKEDITKLFLIEESFEVSDEILTLLCGFLKNESNKIVLDALAHILLKYSKCDAVFTAIISTSSRKFDEKNLEYKNQTDWENYVQLLVTLPERVANQLERNTPKELSHENYSYNLMFHVIRSIDFISDASFHQGIQFDMSYLAHLLSKVIIHYNMSGNSDAIIKFVDILIYWTGPDYTEPNKFVMRKLVQTLLFHLNRQAVDCLSILLLQRCPIDYKAKEQSILNILGDNFNKNKDWNENLTIKTPFYHKPKDYKNTNVVENLIYYISTSKDSEKTLSDLITRLGNAWADVKLPETANISEHMYLSLLLVLAVKYRVYEHTKHNKLWQTNEIKPILFKGMSKHLDVLSKEFRAIGMATTEVILKLLTEIESKDKEAVEKLKFEYQDMGDTCVEIANILKEITTKCLTDKKRKKPKDSKPKTVDVKYILDFIAQKATGEERPVQNTIVSCAVKSPEQTKAIVKTIISAKLDALKGKDKKVEDLDSDDDLQPYDMSNDLPVNAKKRPNYLRDLIDVVNEAKDFESFEAALEASEELVTKQLKNENSKLAIELLDLFIHMEPKFHVDDFDNIKFNTSVAITCSQPKVCAEHLCKEIHADVGRYSIATKIFMLDVLSEAANKIADIRPQPIEENKPKIVSKADETAEQIPAEEIIRRRLINKTRYFRSIQPHPFSKAKRNEFAALSDSFFYPLVRGFGTRQLSLSQHNIKQDFDSILLYKYLSVVGNMILASKNCPKCPQYCAELIPVLMYMRYAADPRIQACVISIVASIVLALPSSILRTEFFQPMMEFRTWLADLLTNVDLTFKLGGPKSETAIFAGQILHLIEKTLGEYD